MHRSDSGVKEVSGGSKREFEIWRPNYQIIAIGDMLAVGLDPSGMTDSTLKVHTAIVNFLQASLYIDIVLHHIHTWNMI